MILKLGKKLLNKKIFRKLNHILNFSQKSTEDFIIKTAKEEIRPGSKILDIGAGSIKYKKYFNNCEFKTQDFKQYGGIDYVSDITKIPVPDQSFDVIICTEVLEHVIRPDLGIAEISRILKPGGIAYITTPFQSGVHHLPHYHSGFSEFWYKHYLEKYRFSDVEIKAKKGFFVFYGQETLRGSILILKSKKWWLYPLAIIGILFVPLFFWLDRFNFDKYGDSYKATIGYLVKAKKI